LDTDAFLGFATIAVLVAITVVPFVRIFQKAGRTGWWAALMLIPIVNILVLWIFAFSRWPALDRNSK
jgi:Na+/melibiose symporter-like transporter